MTPQAVPKADLWSRERDERGAFFRQPATFGSQQEPGVRPRASATLVGMQIVYRARNFADAQTARELLAARGITAHIADKESWEVAGDLPGCSVIRVLVDNQCVDQARRILTVLNDRVPRESGMPS
jgi:hypothetical protein